MPVPSHLPPLQEQEEKKKKRKCLHSKNYSALTYFWHEAHGTRYMYWTCKCHWAHAQEGGAATLNLATWETLGLWRQETLCASRSGELGAGLWHGCEVFNVMHWFVKTTCPHHQHRHELSRMYKNKDFWLKTSLEEFMIISDNGGKVPSGLYSSSGAAAKGWKGCFVLSLRKRAVWRFFGMGLYAHCMCAEYLDQSSARKRNIFLYGVDPTCTKLNHCVCIGSFSISIFPHSNPIKKYFKVPMDFKVSGVGF